MIDIKIKILLFIILKIRHTSIIYYYMDDDDIVITK